MPARSSRRRARVSRIRRLCLQSLEPRQLLATFTVSTLVDESDGNFAAGDFSLREAIEQANLDATADTINFSSAVRGTITLSASELLISKPLTIQGPGANLLSISGDNTSRVFHVYDGGNSLDVSMSGLTIVAGRVFGGHGGGINADAGSDLTLDRMYLHDNQAISELIDKEHAIGGAGGGIAVINARLTILNSTIASNKAVDSGGGIYHDGAGSLDLANPTLRVINTTIANNVSYAIGSGVLVADGAAQFRSSTIVLNDADHGGSGVTTSGGLATFSSNASTLLYNTIVAGNTNFQNPADIAGNVVATSAYNVIGTADFAGGLTHQVNGNYVGNEGTGVKPLNQIVDTTLADNGGPTPTYSVVTGSPALDAGSAALAIDPNGAALAKDQRGFSRIVDGPDPGTTATIDIGAYEASKRTFVVVPGFASLHDAVDRANANAGPDIINFAAGSTGVLATAGDALIISDSLTINGPGADLLALDANQMGSAGVVRIVNAGSVSISGMTIQNGKSASAGGGMFVDNTNLTLRGVAMWGNNSDAQGGGLAAINSVVTLLNCSVYVNTAGDAGGGIFISGPVDTTVDHSQPKQRIINSSILANTCEGEGGGIYIDNGAVLVRNTTVALNRANQSGASPAASSGGGVLVANAPDDYCTLQNSIVGGNGSGEVSSARPDDVLGKDIGIGSANNLIGDPATSGGLDNGVNGNIVGNGSGGILAADVVFNLSILDGEIPALLALPLSGISPALDKGNNSLAVDQNGATLTKDQREKTRIVDRDGNGVATVDIGAVELSPFTLSLSGTTTYTENGQPLILASGATLSAAEVESFNGGALVISNFGADAKDRVIVRHQGNAAGQVGTSGANVYFGGVLIGTKSGGSGNTPLVVTFNADATAAAVQAVARRIGFSSSSDNPPTNTRSIRFVVRDNVGATTNVATKSVKVVAVPDSPNIGDFGSAVTYTEDTAAIGVVVTATVSDVDSFNFDGGKLWTKISANAELSDRLSIRNVGGVSTSSNEIFIGGDVIGTFTGGSGSTALVITFNNLADSADVQAVLRAIAYRDISQNPSSKTRTLSVILTDGDGGTSVTSKKSINVKPVNDKPVLGSISGSVGYVHNAAAIVVAGSATVTDVDSANFGGGRLRVQMDAADASNRLSIAGAFTVDASNSVLLNGVVIGTRTSSGFGTSDLFITFKTAATKAIVQQLVRAITFKTVNGAAGSRNVIFTVSDGDGGLSTEVSKTVNVT